MKTTTLNTNDSLSHYFGLSYASWLTLPRVMMEAMPEDWQIKMASLLFEFDETFKNQPDLGTRVQITKDGRLVKTPEWIINYRRSDLRRINEGKEQWP